MTRDIEGRVLIIPLTAGIVEVEGELFTLNSTGRSIWLKLGQQRTLREVAALVADEFAAPLREVEGEVLRFARELQCCRLLAVYRAR